MRALLAIGPLAGVALLAWWRSSSAPASSSTAVLEEIAVTARRVVGAPWTLPKSGEPYKLAIAAAELRNGVPHNLLARLLWQESHFRPEIISGELVSSAGAVGIAQIVPRWHPNVNPRDPFASIDYAASYLRDLRRRFGAWELALAAYNWGLGNLGAAIKMYGAGVVLEHASTPKETRDYVAQITRDVPVAIGVVS